MFPSRDSKSLTSTSSITSAYSHHRVQLSETPWWPYRYLCREILLRRVRTALYNSREVYINPITNAGVLTGYRVTAVQLVIGLDIIGPRRPRSFHWRWNSAYVSALIKPTGTRVLAISQRYHTLHLHLDGSIACTQYVEYNTSSRE